MTAPRVLLTVSGVIPAEGEREAEAGLRPRADYTEIARAAGADLLDLDEARRSTGAVGRLVERLGGRGPLLAVAAFKRRRGYDVVVTDGEHVGFPYAALLTGRRRTRRPRHVMVAHHLSPPKKRMMYRALRLGRSIDTMVVYCSRQRAVALERFGRNDGDVTLVPFMVDTAFWSPEQRPRTDPPTICATGREYRDHWTLVDAVRDLPVQLVITLGSAWSQRPDSTGSMELPANVTVHTSRLSYADLRELYASSAFVVVPLVEVEFQAGITSILEGMSMGKAIVCSRIAGQDDTVVQDVNGVYVAPADPLAMRDAIVALLADPDRCAAMGANGRELATREADVEVYAERIGSIVRSTVA